MRVRVIVEGGQPTTWFGPISTGILLTPVAAVIGTAILSYTVPYFEGRLRFNLGVLFGSIIACPGTIIMLPLLYYAKKTAPVIVMVGTISAFMLSWLGGFLALVAGTYAFLLSIVAGTGAGLVVSIIYAWWAVSYRASEAAWRLKTGIVGEGGR